MSFLGSIQTITKDCGGKLYGVYWGGGFAVEFEPDNKAGFDAWGRTVTTEYPGIKLRFEVGPVSRRLHWIISGEEAMRWIEAERRTVEIAYNGIREYCHSFDRCGDEAAAIRVCKKRVCRKLGVNPSSILGQEMMEMMIATVDHPESVAQIVEDFVSETTEEEKA